MGVGVDAGVPVPVAVGVGVGVEEAFTQLEPSVPVREDRTKPVGQVIQFDGPQVVLTVF